MAEYKLTDKQKSALKLAIDGWVHDFPAWKDSPMRKNFIPSATLKALEARGLVSFSSKHVIERGGGEDNIYYHRYLITDAGRDALITPAPANVEPAQADITPAERAAVEAMAETEANVFADDDDEPIVLSDEQKDDLKSRFEAMRAERKAAQKPNVLDVPAAPDEISKQDAVKAEDEVTSLYHHMSKDIVFDLLVEYLHDYDFKSIVTEHIDDDEHENAVFQCVIERAVEIRKQETKAGQTALASAIRERDTAVLALDALRHDITRTLKNTRKSLETYEKLFSKEDGYGKDADKVRLEKYATLSYEYQGWVATLEDYRNQAHKVLAAIAQSRAGESEG